MPDIRMAMRSRSQLRGHSFAEVDRRNLSQCSTGENMIQVQDMTPYQSTDFYPVKSQIRMNSADVSISSDVN